MKQMNMFSIVCFAMFCLFNFNGNAFGGAFDNSAIGLRGISMGAFPTGIADDATAIYFNPGGMAFNEKNTWYAEIYTYYAPTDFEHTANSITDNSNEAFLIPGFFITKRFDRWAFGFGSYIPYAGGGTAYDNFQKTGFDLESFAGWFAFTPAVAYRISENLSVGLGFSAYMAVMEGEEYNPLISATVENEYDGIAGYGGHIGVFYKPFKELGVGLTVRSAIPIEMDGVVEVFGTEIDSEVELTFPCSFTLGFGYEAGENLTFGLSFCYMLWNHLDEIKIKTEGQKTVEEPTGYGNNWIIGMGMEYKTKTEIILRTGLKYDQGSTRNKWLNARSNDVDKLTPSIGLAYSINDFVEMNIIALRVFGFEEEYNSVKFDQDDYSITLGARIKY